MTRERNVVVIPAHNEQPRILGAIMGIMAQNVEPHAVVVVDNASTDQTAEIVKELQEAGKKDLHLLHEPQKGVAHALNRGFNFAAQELGASILSRIDADTIPTPSWNRTILEYFASHPKAQMLTGPSYPRTDKEFKIYDDILWRIARIGYRLFNVATMRSRLPLRVAHGHNLSVRAKAFEAVGGFPNAGWEDILENVELSRRIFEMYGFEGLAYSNKLQVFTSMRRIRSAGYIGIMLGRGNLAKPPNYSKYITKK